MYFFSCCRSPFRLMQRRMMVGERLWLKVWKWKQEKHWGKERLVRARKGFRLISSSLPLRNLCYYCYFFVLWLFDWFPVVSFTICKVSIGDHLYRKWTLLIYGTTPLFTMKCGKSSSNQVAEESNVDLVQYEDKQDHVITRLRLRLQIGL